MYVYFQSTELTKHYLKFSDFQVGCSFLLKCLWVSVLRSVIHSKWSALLWYSHNYCSTRQIKSTFESCRKEIFFPFFWLRQTIFHVTTPANSSKRGWQTVLKVLCHRPQKLCQGWELSKPELAGTVLGTEGLELLLPAAHLGFPTAGAGTSILRGEIADFSKDKTTTDQGRCTWVYVPVQKERGNLNLYTGK